MTRKSPSGQSGPQEPNHPRRSSERPLRGLKTAPSLLDTMIENLLGNDDPQAILNREVQSGTLKGRPKTAERILEVVHELDSRPSFGKKIAFLNTLAESGKLSQDIYSSLSRAVVRHDVRAQNPSLEAQLPLKWAQYWRGASRLVDEIESGGLVTSADIDDVRRRFDRENVEVRDAIRDKIGGTLLTMLDMSESEQRKKRYSIDRILTATELLYGDEQARLWRAGYALASFLHNRGEFSVRKTADGDPSPFSLGTLTLLTQRVAPILRTARWSAHKGEETDITPEQRGILASASAQVLSFLTRVNTDEFEKEIAKDRLNDQRSDARILHMAEGIKVEDETIDRDLIRSHAEEGLDSVRKTRLAQRIASEKQLSFLDEAQIRSASYASVVLAQRMLNMIRRDDEIIDLQATHDAITLSPAKERRQRARIEEEIERESTTFEQMDEELRYGSLDAHLRAKELSEDITEQSRHLSEEGERRMPSGKAGRLRRKLALIDGQLKRCALYRKRLAPLQTELEQSQNEAKKTKKDFEQQHAKLLEQRALLVGKKRPAKTDAAKVEKLNDTIARIEAEFEQVQDSLRRTQDRLQRQIDSLQVVIDQEKQFKADREAKQTSLDKVQGKLRTSISDRIRFNEQEIEELLEQDKLYGKKDRKRTEMVEEDDTLADDGVGVDEIEREMRVYLYRPNRRKIHDTESETYIDLVMGQIALEQERREQRKAEIARIRTLLYEELSLRYGSDEDREFMRIKNEIMQAAYEAGAINVQPYRESSELVEALRAALLDSPADALFCDAHGPQVIINNLRIHIPKRLALAVASDCLKGWESRVNNIRIHVQDLYAQGKAVDAHRYIRNNALSLWQYAKLDAILKAIDTYRPTSPRRFDSMRPRRTYQDRLDEKMSRLNALRYDISKALMPKYLATVLYRISTFKRENEETTQSFKQNVIASITAIYERIKDQSPWSVESTIRNASYYFDDILGKNPDTYAYFQEIHGILMQVFKEVFPPIVLEMSRLDSESPYNSYSDTSYDYYNYSESDYPYNDSENEDISPEENKDQSQE